MNAPRAPILPVALLAVALACNDDDPTRPGGPEVYEYLEPTSPANVIENLVRSHHNRDIDGYAGTLSRMYVFIPSAADTSIHFQYLTRAEDLASTAGMFEAVREIRIRLDAPDPAPSTVPGYPEAEGYLMMTVPFVRIEVLTREGDPDDPLIYLVNDDQARVVFEPDRRTTPVTYTIAYLQDLSTGRTQPRTTESWSWSDLKNIYLTRPAYVAPTSPTAVLTNLMLSHAWRDVAAYDALFADEFVFVPSSADPEVGYDRLTRSEDHASTATMFDSVQLLDLELDVVDAVRSPFVEYPGERGYLLMEVPAVRLHVLTRVLVSGGALAYAVLDDPARFIFQPDSTLSPVTYTIVYQQDLGSHPRIPWAPRPAGHDPTPVERATWSWIKGLYL